MQPTTGRDNPNMGPSSCAYRFRAVFHSRMMRGANEGRSSCRKPALSYTQLIQQALSSRADGTMRLHDIYSYLRSHYAYFRRNDEGWKVC